MLLLLATGRGRCAAPFFFLGRGVTTVAVVVSFPAAVAHAEFTFCNFVRISDGVMCWLRPFPVSLLLLASGSFRFRMVETSSSSFLRSSL